MKVVPTDLPGVLVVEPAVYRDERGFFLEQFQLKRYEDAGIEGPWTQENLSRSRKGTLRGLHFQEPNAQGKLVMVVAGAVFDVAVDIRRGSPTFGNWFGCELNDENRHQLWVPPGFAHGFVTLSDTADFFYKCARSFYDPASEGVVRYNDPAIGIQWPLDEISVNDRDGAAPLLENAENLPAFQG
ncbi:MAG: dTDP-4-dehydrorhamnose 3,5-epimerase [Rhodospirillaceae bacterium]|jgi:dTDP-4-dehydrorhamnose 3,5-epimerase|nr:dTDP-4-dehydrorhamnose 3,5-epimerase [Rhodospirillaceae bacterium]MBT5812541.1 dTDP-4-dehydrorhamnose 3,5-epimerase [Rhodospirillaceae bacterium]